jgi:hypothetical protein
VKRLDALHGVLLGVHNVKFTLVVAVKKVAHDGTTRLMYVITAADDDDTLWF